MSKFLLNKSNNGCNVRRSRRFLNLFKVTEANYFSDDLWEIAKKDAANANLIPVLLFSLGDKLMTMIPLDVVELRDRKSLDLKTAYIASRSEIYKRRRAIVKNAKNLLRRI
jgi:hypothetical protein